MKKFDMYDLWAARQQCSQMLEANGLRITTQKGRLAVYCFWMGALCHREEIAPYVKLCLQTGRYEDLILAPTANKRRHNAEANVGSTEQPD